MYEDAFYDGGDEEEPEDYSHLTEDHAPMLVNIPNPSEEESVTFEPVTPVTPGDGGRFHCHATGKSFPQIIFNLREEFPTSKGTRALTLLEGKKIINKMKWLHGSVSTPNDAARRDAAVSGNPLAGFNNERLANPLYPFETEEDRWLADYFFRHGLSQGALKELIAKMKAGFNWEGVGYKDYKGMKKIIRKVPLQVRLLSSPPPPKKIGDKRLPFRSPGRRSL